MRGFNLVLLVMCVLLLVKTTNATIFLSIEKLHPIPKKINISESNIPDNLRLEGIICAKFKYAIINGKTYKVSDKIGECTVEKISIERRVVILICNDKPIKLELK